jgi:Ca2+-binding EF-hand superfamily protein
MLLANKWVKIDKSIPTLLTQLDHDKNGSLNEAEVIASKDDQLVKHFKDIDKNADAEISEVELKSYLAALK